MMRTAGGASALPRQCHRQTWGKSNNSGIEIAEGLAEQPICRALTRSGFCESAREANVNVSFSVEPRTAEYVMKVCQLNLSPAPIAVHPKRIFRSEERRVGKECRSRW